MYKDINFFPCISGWLHVLGSVGSYGTRVKKHVKPEGSSSEQGNYALR